MTDTPLRFFNSLTRSIETFRPIEPGRARIYSCGPTVYHYAHLGNLRAYVFTDTLCRSLNFMGLKTEHVINITDVGHLTSDADVGDDKMEAAAAREAKTIWDVARFYTDAFKSDIAALNIRPPQRWSVATDHIDDMIAFAEKISAAHCYEIDSGLYFDSTSVPDYGALAGHGQGPSEARIDEVKGKRHTTDFAIWRKSAPQERRQMEWDSPWGKGAPGWHLECSVMSMKYLGTQFDIHTGGIDHREIHHPNEIAQNQAYTGSAASGANWWMHNNFLVVRDGKMSKSKGEFATLRSITDRGVHPLAYRLMCLQAHYRSELEFSGENLVAALTRLKRLVMLIERLRSESTGEAKRNVEATAHLDLAAFREALCDDLAIPRVLPLLEKALGDPSLSAAARLTLAGRMDEVLGLCLDRLTRADLRIRPLAATVEENAIESRLLERAAARARKDFFSSDRIRDELAADGVDVMDGDPIGWEWKVVLD